jgi:hypothetical protein
MRSRKAYVFSKLAVFILLSPLPRVRKVGVLGWKLVSYCAVACLHADKCFSLYLIGLN